MAFALPDLPYAKDALEPHMSSKTFDYHYGKHHQAYVNKTNDAIKGTEHEGKSLVEVVRAAKANDNQGLFNNSAQIWNHTFLWNSFSPNGGGAPSGKLAEMINDCLWRSRRFQEGIFGKGRRQFRVRLDMAV